MALVQNDLLKIGDKIEKFIERLGEPVSKSDILYTFDLGIKESSYLTATVNNDEVYHVSWSKKTFGDKVKEQSLEMFGEQFLPHDIEFVKKIENKIIPSLNEDTPMSIYEYYSESTKGKGFIKNEEESGYLTLYITHENGDSNFTITLGREESIQ